MSLALAGPVTLHAVHANLQAFTHASPNSSIGRIAAHAQATVAAHLDGEVTTLATCWRLETTS